MNIQRRKNNMEQENAMMLRYRQADELERLFMYVQYRDMRDDFMEIELKDSLHIVKSQQSARSSTSVH